MLNAVEVKKGIILSLNGELFSVVSAQFVSPGKGSAFVKTKLKNLQKQTVIEYTFKSSEKVKNIELEKRYMTYLYQDGDDFIFMDKDDYEQFHISRELIKDLIPFMKEEMPLEVKFYNEQPITVIAPTFIELEVTYAETVQKGDTVGTARKRVTLETEGEIMVPLFIEKGDFIKIDLRDFSFVERITRKET